MVCYGRPVRHNLRTEHNGSRTHSHQSIISTYYVRWTITCTTEHTLDTVCAETECMWCCLCVHICMCASVLSAALVLTHRQFTRLNVFIAPNNVTQVNAPCWNVGKSKRRVTTHSLISLRQRYWTTRRSLLRSSPPPTAEFIKMQLYCAQNSRSEAVLKIACNFSHLLWC